MNDPRDWQFHDEELSALYRANREVEPPAWLDQRVLTAARAAVEPPPAPRVALPRRSGGFRRWTVPVALAATVVLAVGLVRLTRELGELGMPLEEKTVQSLAKPTVKRDAEPANASGPTAVSPMSMPAPPPVPAQPVAPSAGTLQPAPRSERGAPILPQAAPAARAKQEDRLRAAPARSDEESATVRNQAVHRTPAEWLAEIVELRRQGRMAEAEVSLTEFRRQYPAYPLDTAPEPPR